MTPSIIATRMLRSPYNMQKCIQMKCDKRSCMVFTFLKKNRPVMLIKMMRKLNISALITALFALHRDINLNNLSAINPGTMSNKNKIIASNTYNIIYSPFYKN